MTMTGKDHYELMTQFEQQFSDRRLNRESKELWSKCRVYQDGQTNDLFLAFRRGAAYGIAIA